MSYWASGEFDEHGNYVLPRTWESLPVDNTEPLKLDVNLRFIKQRKEKAEFKTREYFDWCRFYSYSNMAVEFYWQTLAAFNKYFIVDKIKNLPQSFGGWQNLDGLAGRFNECESNLVEQFGRYNRNVNVEIKKYASLRSAVNYAALAWMMYHLMYDKLSTPRVKENLSSILAASISVNNQHPVTDEEKLLHYNQLVALKQEIGTKLSQDFMRTNHCYLYRDVESYNMFNNVVGMAGGMDLDELDKQITNYADGKNYSNDVGLVLWFYKNRKMILKSSKELDKKVENWQTSKIKNINIFALDGEPDAYQKVAAYRKKLLEAYNLANKNFSSAITDDIVSVGKVLASSLANAKEIYNEYLLEMEDAARLVQEIRKD